MKRSMRIELTEAQAELIAWALAAGLEQHEKFLRHDEWDADLTSRRARHEALWPDRQWKKAIKMFSEKVATAEVSNGTIENDWALAVKKRKEGRMKEDRRIKKAMIDVIVIDPIAKTIQTRGIINSLTALQKIVDGHIEFGTSLTNGDLVIVNESGGNREDWKEKRAAFKLLGRAFMGPAVIAQDSADAKSTLDEVKKLVTFAR